ARATEGRAGRRHPPHHPRRSPDRLGEGPAAVPPPVGDRLLEREARYFVETVTRRWRLGLLLACLWLATSGAACGLFRPARPEPPSQSAYIPDYSTVEATLLTMKRGIEDKARSNGLSAYIGALADTNTDHRAFHAFFDQ